MHDEELDGEEIEHIEPEKRAKDGRKLGRRALNPGGARPNSGPKPAIAKIEDKLRKKLDAEFWVQAAETFGPTFIDVVMNDDVPWEIRFKTWQEINNRAYGKPKETVNQNINGAVSLTDLFNHATKSPTPTGGRH